MASFQIAVALTLQHEGGYVDNPADPGGATNMGVEQRDVPDIPIRTLTVEQATAFYSANYWKPFYSQINDQAGASKLFDMGVLFGITEAVEQIQRVLQIEPDGDFGPETLCYVNEAGSGLLAAYKAAMLQRARAITEERPSEIIFLNGWMNRINS
jgi:lysozyme family protein